LSVLCPPCIHKGCVGDTAITQIAPRRECHVQNVGLLVPSTDAANDVLY